MVSALLLVMLVLSFLSTSVAAPPKRLPEFQQEQQRIWAVDNISQPLNGWYNDSEPGWLDPRVGGGSMVDYTTKRRGEPLNVIISGRSHPRVLTDDGFWEYANSIGFARECFGWHVGTRHGANLGDGNGKRDEIYLARQSYFFASYGACWETLAGGNHFRAWKQNGPDANTNAWFLGVSKEKCIGKHHLIVPNGYNVGRDLLIEQAVKGDGKWIADVEWIDDLLPPGKDGINHGIEQDGRVAVLTVRPVDPSNT